MKGDVNSLHKFEFIQNVYAQKNYDNFPDFLIIGPQRTGTTWLFRNLIQHHQVFMPSAKELYYFSDLISKKRNVPNDLGWYLRQFEIDPEEQGQVLIKGEATATYATLPEKVIKEITTINSDLKIILLLRDPVERAWSDAKRVLSRSRKKMLDEISEDEFKAYFTLPYQLKCGRINRIIDSWSIFIKPKNIFVGSFRQIHESPKELMHDLCLFLDIEPMVASSGMERRINATETYTLPFKLRQYLERLFDEEIELLRKNYPEFN